MNKDYTQLVLVVDRSGSMSSLAFETQNAINALIKEQKEHPSRCDLFFTEFDHEHNVVHNGNLQSCPEYTLQARGVTSLADAVGMTIKSVGEKLAKMPEEDRPGQVLFVIATDGMENNSKDYSMSQVAEMIKHQKDKYDWIFQFIGVEIDAEKVAEQLNIGAHFAATVSFANNAHSYGVTSAKLASIRSGALCGLDAEELVDRAIYTSSDKAELNS